MHLSLEHSKQKNHLTQHKTTITILAFCITALAMLTTSYGIFSNEDSGVYYHESIRGQTIELYGKGLYKHMSADVAIQGIAQDFITLFAGILKASNFWIIFSTVNNGKW